MAIATFIGNVTFGNQLMFPRELYPAISVPPGVTPYDAIAKTMAEMVTISTDRNRRYDYRSAVSAGIGIPAGFTLSDLSVRFLHFGQQWRRTGDNWTYCGGTINLNLTLTVYADSRTVNKARCWALILEHELLHVADEIEIVKNHLPRTLSQSPMIRGFLQQPIANSDFQRDIRGTGSGEGSVFEQRIQRSIWVPESSARAARLHQQRPGDGTAIRDCINESP